MSMDEGQEAVDEVVVLFVQVMKFLDSGFMKMMLLGFMFVDS